MAKFRERFISNIERNFVEQCFDENLRVDERCFNEFRELKIQFGRDWGSCHVALGDTKVVAQVSCEVQTPNSSRPSEGILYVNLELSPLAAPHFEAGRQSNLSVQLNRLLEKCIKDSKAVDLESLCIKVNEKVWAFRVDCNVLNDEGNIVDCASVAALAALAHFRRPDVTCDGEEVIIHTYAQRDSIPTVIHHYPVCVSYAIFRNGDIILADPSLLEDQMCEAQLTVGLNSYKEVCGFHLAGSAMMSPEHILETTARAGNRADFVISEIKRALAEDAEARLKPEGVSFANSYLFTEAITPDPEALDDLVDSWTTVTFKKRGRRAEIEEMPDESAKEVITPAVVEVIGNQSAALVPPHTVGDVWNVSDEDDNVKHEEDDVQVVTEEIIQEKPVDKKVPKRSTAMDTDDSEEETTIVLNANKLTQKNKGRRK